MEKAQSVEEFWLLHRGQLGYPTAPTPPAWAFGATAEHADELLALVLDGTKTGTASSLWDYEFSGDTPPKVGELSIILDGQGRPRALIETTGVTIVPFMEVGAEHAYSEGEGDRTIAAWRDIHTRFWSNHAEDPRGYDPAMPVVCERFRLLLAADGPSAKCPRDDSNVRHPL